MDTDAHPDSMAIAIKVAAVLKDMMGFSSLPYWLMTSKGRRAAAL
jgi:hypothetical protein